MGAITAVLEELARPGEHGEGPERSLKPGIVVGRFELVRELGRGGFGVVYEARDRELGRTVAFKAIQAGPRVSVREERLLREAEAAARLSHPNVVTLYDIGQSEHGPYLILELLRGETLAQRLRLGPCSVQDAVRIALEVARGLAHAHAHGVVHRDLTPGNVFLCRDGQVKILDLGMAHAFGHRKVAGGTAGYMAPEQERGAPEDERTDVFALGVILYRMLAGQLPPDPDPTHGAAGAPRLEIQELPALAELVSRMLAHDPVERPRDAGDVATALEPLQRELTSAAGGDARAVSVRLRGEPAAASVAVLPFADLSPTRDQEWLCDGFAEEILHSLAGLAGLRVASRGASFQFKGRSVEPRTVASTLGVTTLLEGSVRRAGPRVRVTARLVGEDGYEVWSRTFDRILEDVFEIQEEIGHAVAAALEVQLSSSEARRLERPGTRNTRALEKYLKARHLGFHDPKLARELLKEAIATDARFAEAHAALANADVYLLEWHQLEEDRETLQREALAASEEALRLDPALAEAHVSRANLLMLAGRSAEADEEFRRATALNPGLASAWEYHGRFLIIEGRFEEAAFALEEAGRCDPEDYSPIVLLPQVYRTLGDHAREAASIDRVLAVTERWIRLNPDDARAHHVLGGFCLRRGERARGEALLARALEMKPDEEDVLYDCACSYAVIGEAERALDLLQRAVATGAGNRSWYENDSDFDSIRRHPRFQEIIARLPP